jgi:hypothetical protein
LNKLSGLELLFIEGEGHYPRFENPEAFFREIILFIENSKPGKWKLTMKR